MNFDFSEIQGPQSPKKLNTIFLEEELKELKLLIDSVSYCRVEDLLFDNGLLRIIPKFYRETSFGFYDIDYNFNVYLKKLKKLVEKLKYLDVRSIRIENLNRERSRFLFFKVFGEWDYDLNENEVKYLIPLFEHSQVPYVPYQNDDLNQSSIKQAVLTEPVNHKVYGKTVIFAKTDNPFANLIECENLIYHYPTILSSDHYRKFIFSSVKFNNLLKSLYKSLSTMKFSPLDIWIVSPYEELQDSQIRLLIGNKKIKEIKNRFPIKNIFFVEASDDNILLDMINFPGNDEEIFRYQNLTKITQLS